MRWTSLATTGWTTSLAFAAAAQAQMAPEATVEKAANDELLWLAVLTMVIAVGVSVWQVLRVRKAKRTGERSSLRDAASHPPAKRD